jgi:hypothetical protein
VQGKEVPLELRDSSDDSKQEMMTSALKLQGTGFHQQLELSRKKILPRASYKSPAGQHLDLSFVTCGAEKQA